ncbi:hypothetical protein L209DRAFT_692839 [Thermothelomyces heterothallicus CBS 203.75]
MEEDIQERKRLRIPVPKYDAFSSREPSPDPSLVPSKSYLETWRSRPKMETLEPNETEENGNGERESSEEKQNIAVKKIMDDTLGNVTEDVQGANNRDETITSQNSPADKTRD